MGMSRRMDKIESYTPTQDAIAGVLASDAWVEIVPKTNGQPGNWRNTVADVFQLSPDGSTVYLQPAMVLNFAVERDGITSILSETIPGLDVNPETGETYSLDKLKVLRRDGILNRQGGSATTETPAEVSEGVFEGA